MKAVQINNYGGTEQIQIANNAQKPIPKSGQLLVEVYAASLNRFDSALRNGMLKEMLPLVFPVSLGGDFAGTVAELGDNVTDFKIGDDVYGQAGAVKGGSGAIAEYVLVNAINTGIKPKSVDFEHSAAIPLVAASALEAIEENINLTSGKRILINGGSGSVGKVAVQLAKLRGAYVAATVKRITDAKSLGADEVIDTSKEDFTKSLKDYDAVFDTVGGDLMNHSFRVLKNGGVLVTIAGMPDKELASKQNVTAISQMTKADTKQLNRLADLVDNGKINISVDEIFSLEEARDAFDYFETQPVKGKVVIKIK